MWHSANGYEGGDTTFNYTYNVSKMWYAAQPEEGIRCIYGKNGKDALDELKVIREYMEEHEEECRKMEPSNGWGTYEGAYEFILELMMECRKYPKEIWYGD